MSSMTQVAPDFAIYLTLGFTVLALILFALERIPTEVSGLLLLCGLLLAFHFFPVTDARGVNLLTTERLLSGFGNPALVAVLALLVVGEGLVQTDALNALGRLASRVSQQRAWFAVSGVLLLVAGMSGFINNTPLVIIFIPILQAIANRLKISAGAVMMPLSYATILGGMTTLMGSSTNMLVSSALTALDHPPLGLFEVTPIGLAVAVVGMSYTLFFARRLLPQRDSLTALVTGVGGKEFVAQLTVGAQSRLVGKRVTAAGTCVQLPDVKVKLVQRDEHAYTAPLDEVVIQPGDLLVVAATRQDLMTAIQRDPAVAAGQSPGEENNKAKPTARQMLAEFMVVPRTWLVGRDLEQINFRHRTGCVVVGIYRRAHLIQQRMTLMRLQAGDVLLVQGDEKALEMLRQRHEMVLLAGTAGDLRRPRHGWRAVIIFCVMIALAASGVMPIVLAAIVGAAAMLITGTLTLRQAARAVDRRIIMLVGSALALGEAMDATGAGAYLAQTLTQLLNGAPAAVMLAAFAGLVMMITNVLSNNACAVLFTPIGVSIATTLHVDPHIFAIAVLVAADGCFATPIGYQTNLLVMGPGNYTFFDYVRFGLPLTVLVWLTLALTSWWWFGL